MLSVVHCIDSCPPALVAGLCRLWMRFYTSPRLCEEQVRCSKPWPAPLILERK